MALNIFPKRREPVVVSVPEPEVSLPEPSPELLEEPRKKTRRGSRGGRGRRRPGEGSEGEPGPEGEVEEATDAEAPVPAPRTRRPRVPKVAPEETAPELTALPDTAEQPDVAAPRRSNRRRAPVAAEPAEEAEVPAPDPGRAPRSSRAPAADASTATILRAIEQQGRQIEHLVRVQEESAKRGGAAAPATFAPPARVGIFVDAANVELGLERTRTRVDWGKVLDILTRGRQLVRAVAYCPVHDDPSVSIETQRFVEPFLDKGYKVVTKQLKRFADNTVKANVDIEMALDIMTMLDRLDVVCLVSGDGDFQRLVELVQSKGIRVEVIGVGSSTATTLRHAADQYTDLQARLRDIRL